MAERLLLPLPLAREGLGRELSFLTTPCKVEFRPHAFLVLSYPSLEFRVHSNDCCPHKAGNLDPRSCLGSIFLVRLKSQSAEPVILTDISAILLRRSE